MMHTRGRRLSLLLVLPLALGGCSFFSQDLRDTDACQGVATISVPDSLELGGAEPLFLAQDLRTKALPFASARLGRDINSLARELENTSAPVDDGRESAAVLAITSLSQRISLRCQELSFAPTIAQITFATESVPETLPPPESQSESEERESNESAPTDDTKFVGNPASLRIEAERPAGYNRDLFNHWIDADGNGCDTRREVLIEESRVPVTVGAGCSLQGGEWFSVYDRATTGNPTDFDIDHMVPLKEAWDSGAYAWSAERRQDFANDLSNRNSLIAVTAGSNRSKGADDPAEWLPPNGAYHCTYLNDWVAVKLFWDLSVDDVEFEAIRSGLANC